MPNIANQPFADALAKQYPAPDGIKIFTASETAEKMLAFWSVKQETKSVVLRVGQALARFVLHSCPHCHENLSAQSVRMSQKEREMIASLMTMLKEQPAPKAPSKPAKKQAVQAAPVKTEDDLTLKKASAIEWEELDALTTPGGAQ
jgi:hypothetical protein